MNYIDASFEKIIQYAEDEGVIVPTRKTAGSAGYDFYAAEDTVIPSYQDIMSDWEDQMIEDARTLYKDFDSFIEAFHNPKPMSEAASLTKQYKVKPTLVPTGIKCRLPEGFYLKLVARSSLPLKHWLVLANSEGIIDTDYYNNPDNEGHIYFQLINFAPFPIVIKKGDCFGQGIIEQFCACKDECDTFESREGGFGSTDGK